MKKSILMMGCLALLMAGCNKEQNIEEPQQEAPRHLTFDIAVNYSDDTRAVKTEWEENDKIYVFFDFDETTTNVEYMTMTYDGSSWSYEFSNETMEAALLEKTEGKLYAVYFPIGTPSFTISKPYSYLTTIVFNLASNVQNYFRTNYSSSLEVPYVIDTDGKLTAELNMSLGTQDIQFFVPGITEYDNYLLSCNQMQPTRPSSIVYNSSEKKYTASYSVGGTGIDVKGYYYKDGIVFTGQLISSANDVSQDYEFKVTDTKGTTDESDDVKYTLAFSGKKLVYHDAVKLPALNSGRWTIDGGNYINSHEYVDLGLSVKWATMNVGASSETDYGDYFAWGEKEPYYSNLDPLAWKDGKSAGYAWGSYFDTEDEGTTFTKYATDKKTMLESSDDAATANSDWGTPWRMPTDAEWTALTKTKSDTENYTWTWCDGITTKYNDSTVNGWKVVRKSTGATLFLPAAGHRSGTSSNYVGSRGNYWTSSLNSSDSSRAWFVGIYSGGVYRSYDFRYSGFSVRPVSD